MELPLALPLVDVGVRLALVQVWATATIAALVAGPGLGRVITDGFYRTNYGKGIAGAVVVAVGRAGARAGWPPLIQRLVDPVAARGVGRNVSGARCRRARAYSGSEPTPAPLSGSRARSGHARRWAAGHRRNSHAATTLPRRGPRRRLPCSLAALRR